MQHASDCSQKKKNTSIFEISEICKKKIVQLLYTLRHLFGWMYIFQIKKVENEYILTIRLTRLSKFVLKIDCVYAI